MATTDRVSLIESSKGFSTYAYTVDAPGACLPAMPKLEIAKRPRTTLGRNGYALAGWAVVIGGREIDRKATKRAALKVLDAWLAEHLRKIGA